MRERYTVIQHNIRKHFKLSADAYSVLDAIYTLSRSQACNAKVKYFVDLFDISERTYYNIMKSLKEKGLVEKVKGGVRTTKLWDDAMAGRVAPWTDPSAKTEPKPKTPAENDINTEKSDAAQFAVCKNCAEKLQKMQFDLTDTAKIAVHLCKNCSEILQKLQSDTAKIAVHNTDINNDTDNKDLEPVGSAPFHAIDKIFKTGSEKLSGKSYYKDAKESKQIKLLESRYIQDPEFFIKNARKYFFMVSEFDDEFWRTQPFTPSAFNSFYNRIMCFKLPKETIKQEQQKHRSEWDELMERYGGYEDEKLKYLLRSGSINEKEYDYIREHQVEVPV